MGWGWQLFRAQIFFKQSSCFQVCTLSCILWQLITSKPRVLHENIISFLFGIPLCRHLVCNFSSDNYPSTCFPSFTKQLKSWKCWSLFGPSPAFLCSPVCLSFFLSSLSFFPPPPSHPFLLPFPLPLPLCELRRIWEGRSDKCTRMPWCLARHRDWGSQNTPYSMQKNWLQIR